MSHESIALQWVPEWEVSGAAAAPGLRRDLADRQRPLDPSAAELRALTRDLAPTARQAPTRTTAAGTTMSSQPWWCHHEAEHDQRDTEQHRRSQLQQPVAAIRSDGATEDAPAGEEGHDDQRDPNAMSSVTMSHFTVISSSQPTTPAIATSTTGPSKRAEHRRLRVAGGERRSRHDSMVRPIRPSVEP